MVNWSFARLWSPSSRGPGHRPFTAVTGVRIPLGTPPSGNSILRQFIDFAVFDHASALPLSGKRPARPPRSRRTTDLSSAQLYDEVFHHRAVIRPRAAQVAVRFENELQPLFQLRRGKFRRGGPDLFGP